MFEYKSIDLPLNEDPAPVLNEHGKDGWECCGMVRVPRNEVVPHSETLLPLICVAVAAAGTTLAELDAIAFAAGPGSFTSLSVACGVAQGLAFAHQHPLLAIGTLDAMAASTGGDKVVVALDARMGEVYYGAYERGQQVAPTTVFDPAAVPLPASSGWLACGNGLLPYPSLRERLSGLIADVSRSKKKISTKCLTGKVDARVQNEFGHEVLRAIGFDLNAGRLDVTTHPFCSGFGLLLKACR